MYNFPRKGVSHYKKKRLAYFWDVSIVLSCTERIYTQKELYIILMYTGIFPRTDVSH